MGARRRIRGVAGVSPWVIAATVAVVAAACGDSTATTDGGTGNVTADETDATAIVELAECTVGPTTSVDSPRTVSTSDGDRSYLLSVPPDTPKALLFDFHGTGGEAAGYAGYTRLAELGPMRGYAVVTPQAVGFPERWTVGTIPGPDDMALFEMLADDLSEELCGDDLPAFATGISSGAGMSTQIACLSERAAAVAPVAGVNLHKLCPDLPPISLLAFHGTGDTIVPYVGVPDWRDRNEKSRGYFVGGDVIGSMEAFAERNGCDTEPTITELTDTVDLLAWSDCENGARIELVRIERGGHSLPGTAAEVTNTDSPPYPIDGTVDGRSMIVDFFDSVLDQAQG
jgi:polyhydroxybutyrate depolymerase